MINMMREFFMVIAQVNGVDYLTKVLAESAYSAEHGIMDMGICGKHTYTVTACMAYDRKAMKTDTFIGAALNAVPIDIEKLTDIINARNVEIQNKDEAEKRIREIEKQIEHLSAQLEAQKRVLED